MPIPITAEELFKGVNPGGIVKASTMVSPISTNQATVTTTNYLTGSSSKTTVPIINNTVSIPHSTT
jgi:hypothetical protein